MMDISGLSITYHRIPRKFFDQISRKKVCPGKYTFPDAIKVVQGESVKLTAAPTNSDTHGLASVMVGEKRLEKGEDGAFTVTPTEDTTVDVKFAERIQTVFEAVSYPRNASFVVRLDCKFGYETEPYDAMYTIMGAATEYRYEINNFCLAGTEAEVTASIATPPNWSIDTSKKIEKVTLTGKGEPLDLTDNGNSWTFTIPANQIGEPIWITIADKTQ